MDILRNKIMKHFISKLKSLFKHKDKQIFHLYIGEILAKNIQMKEIDCSHIQAQKIDASKIKKVWN